MGHLAITVSGFQDGVAACANCTAPAFKLSAFNEKELAVTLVASNGGEASGIFTAKQLYELATLAAQVLVAQSEAFRARQP